jgi:hypothetical protein
MSAAAAAHEARVFHDEGEEIAGIVPLYQVRGRHSTAQ